MTAADQVTFLLTDIEGSTRLLARVGDRYPAIIDEHRAIIRDAATRHGGRAASMEGDTCLATFPSASAAVHAAVDMQRSLGAHDWDGETVRVRIGVHTGRALLRHAEYFGLDLHRAARIANAGHGGQILISEPTHTVMRDDPGASHGLVDRGLHRLKDLEAPVRLFEVRADGLAVDHPPLRTLRPDTHNLPAVATALVGREDDVTVVSELLGRHRLVTLVGPGGVGKTRLALHVGASVVDDVADGVWFVELARAGTPADVPTAIAGPLGVETAGAPDPTAVIADALRDRSMLLILDNFEHVVAAAPVVQAILMVAPGIRVLATSRERLLLSAEHVYPVRPLTVTGRSGVRAMPDAVALFVDRARAHDPHLPVDERTLEHITAVCALVDGLPLAIELLAAQTRVLPPHAIRERMREGLDAIAGRERDRPARHRTLRDTIAWSYRLLAPDEQRLFARMAVFRGGRTLDAVAAVCMEGLTTDALSGVTALVDKSLLHRSIAPDGDIVFDMFAHVHELAGQMLTASGEREQVSRRHAEWIAALAERGDDGLISLDAPAWEDLLNRQLDNIRAALEWAFSGADIALGVRLAAALSLFWYWGGPHHDLGQRLRQAMRHADRVDDGTRGRLHIGLGLDGFAQGDLATSRRHWEQALDAFRSAGDVARTAIALSMVAVTYAGRPDRYAHALALVDEALDIATADHPRSRTVADALTCKGEIARLGGDDALARRCHEDALAIARAAGDVRYVAQLQANLAHIAVHDGAHGTALRLLHESLETSWKHGLRVFVASTLSQLAAPELGLGRPERAAVLIGAADAALERFGVSRQPTDAIEHEQTLARLTAAVGGARLRDLLADGARLSLEEAVDHVFAPPDDSA